MKQCIDHWVFGKSQLAQNNLNSVERNFSRNMPFRNQQNFPKLSENCQTNLASLKIFIDTNLPKVHSDLIAKDVPSPNKHW